MTNSKGVLVLNSMDGLRSQKEKTWFAWFPTLLNWTEKICHRENLQKDLEADFNIPVFPEIQWNTLFS